MGGEWLSLTLTGLQAGAQVGKASVEDTGNVPKVFDDADQVKKISLAEAVELNRHKTIDELGNAIGEVAKVGSGGRSSYSILLATDSQGRGLISLLTSAKVLVKNRLEVLDTGAEVRERPVSSLGYSVGSGIGPLGGDGHAGREESGNSSEESHGAE